MTKTFLHTSSFEPNVEIHCLLLAKSTAQPLHTQKHAVSKVHKNCVQTATSVLQTLDADRMRQAESISEASTKIYGMVLNVCANAVFSFI